jgi:hypothetical protein
MIWWVLGEKEKGSGLLVALVIIPKAFSGVPHYLVVSEPCAIVVQQGKLVWGQNVGSRLGVEFCPDLRKAFFEELSKALVDTAFAVLSNVDGLAEREIAMASYIFCVATHVDVVVVIRGRSRLGCVKLNERGRSKLDEEG